MALTESEWLFISDIIYKFNLIEDYDVARSKLLKSLRVLIKCDSATFFLADPSEEYSLDQPVLDDFAEELANDYLEHYIDIDYCQWMFESSTGQTYRSSDLFSAQDRNKEQYYREFYGKANICYDLFLTLTHANQFVGILSFYRSSKWDDFNDHDAQILNALEKHISLRTYRHIYGEPLPQACAFALNETNLTANLTAREQEILQLIFDGTPDAIITKTLSISENTLRSHIGNIYRKLGIRHRNELFRIFNTCQ